MVKKPLKIAVLGCGYWGPNLVRNFSKDKNSEVVMVVDKDYSRLKYIRKLYPKIIVSQNISDCFIKNACDAVVVSLPVSMHYAVVEKALKDNKHVFCEKPLAESVSQTEKLFKLAGERKRVLFVDYTYIYSNEIRYLKKICKKLGDGIYTIDMRRLSFGIFQKDIDVILDLAPHDISILIYLLGEPEKVLTVGHAHINRKIVDDAHLVFVYKRGLLAHIHVSWLFPKKVRDITIVAKNKMIVYDDTKTKDKIEIVKKGVSLQNLPKPPYYATYRDFAYRYRVGKGFIPKIAKTEPLEIACREFLKKVLQDQSNDANLSLKVARILETSKDSLRGQSFIHV